MHIIACREHVRVGVPVAVAPDGLGRPSGPSGSRVAGDLPDVVILGSGIPLFDPRGVELVGGGSDDATAGPECLT